MQSATALGTNRQHPKQSANTLANKLVESVLIVIEIWSLLLPSGRLLETFFFSTFYIINNIPSSEMGEWKVYTFMQLQIVQAKFSYKTRNAFFLIP